MACRLGAGGASASGVASPSSSVKAVNKAQPDPLCDQGVNFDATFLRLNIKTFRQQSANLVNGARRLQRQPNCAGRSVQRVAFAEREIGYQNRILHHHGLQGGITLNQHDFSTIQSRYSLQPIAAAQSNEIVLTVSHPGTSAPAGTIDPVAHAIERYSIAHILKAKAASHGSVIAVDDGKSCLSYRELLQQAATLAAALAPHPGPIGILLPIGTSYIVAIVAAILAGKTYVPMDVGFPEKRNQRIASHSGLRAVIAETVATAPLLDERIERIPMDGLPAPTPPAALGGGPGHIVAIFYTSGSSGEPKGVCHSEEGLLYDVSHFIESHGMGPGEVHSLLFSPSVSISNRDIFGTLLAGGKLCIVDMKALGIGATLQALKQHGVTVFHSVPSAFRALFGAGHPDARPVAGNIKLVRLNGDRVLRGDVDLYRDVFSRDCRLSLDIACTETRPYAAWQIDHDTPLLRPLVPVGYPRPDLHVTLVDEQDVPVSLGEVGEIIVASQGLSAGYWRDEALTREKFVSSVRYPGTAEYRTGDFGRLLPDGLLEFVGRRDRQVKVRGNTVHLGEIEAAIAACPGVDAAAVITRQERNETRLVAYCAGPATEIAIRAWCRQTLAIVPGDVVATDTLPMLATGKVDLLELERRDAMRQARQSQGEPVKDAGAVADLVQRVWCRRLGEKSFHDNLTFEEAGGDSLLAMQILLELERGREKPLPSGLIDWRTRPSELASRILSPQAGTSGSKPSLFLFPGIYGADFASSAFARRLSADFSVHLMDYRCASDQFIGPADRERVFAQFDALVAAEMPQRLWLVGYSLGTRVAAEAGRRLLLRGIPVEFMGLIDGPTEGAVEAIKARRVAPFAWNLPRPKQVADYGGLFGYVTARLAAQIAHALERRGHYGQLEQFIHRLSRWKLRAAATQATRVAVGRPRIKAFRGLPLKPLPMPISLFISNADPALHHSRDLGWSDFCTGLEIFELDGDHNEILSEERSGAIAAILRDAEARLRHRQSA